MRARKKGRKGEEKEERERRGIDFGPIDKILDTPLHWPLQRTRETNYRGD